MVKIDNLNNQPLNNQTNSANQPNSTPANPVKEESSIIKTIGQLLPLAPFVFEQFTGQKVPQMTGTIAEMQMALISIQNGLQTIANNQQTLSQRITNLETNANNHLTNLTHQFKSLRLTHTQETKLSETQKKQIEFNQPQSLEENQEY